MCLNFQCKNIMIFEITSLTVTGYFTTKDMVELTSVPHKTPKGGFMFKAKGTWREGVRGRRHRTLENIYGSTKKINRKLALLKKTLKKNR